MFWERRFPIVGTVPLWGQTSDPRRERASGGAGRPGAAFPLFSPCSFLLFLSFFFFSPSPDQSRVASRLSGSGSWPLKDAGLSCTRRKGKRWATGSSSLQRVTQPRPCLCTA